MKTANYSKAFAIFSNRSSFLVFIFGFVLPLEDFLFQDIVGSFSRIIAILIFLNYLFVNGLPKLRYISRYSILYCIVILLSLSWSIYPDSIGVIRIFILLFLCLIFASLQKNDPNTIFKFMIGFIISGSYLAIRTIAGFLSSGEIERVTIEEINNNLLANTITLTTLFIIFLIIHFKFPRILIPLLIFFIFVDIAALISTGSRGGYLGFLICLLFYLKGLSSRFILLGTFIIISFISIIQFTDKFDSFIKLFSARLEKTNEDYGGNRVTVWKAGIEMFYEHPFTGVGFRNFRFESIDYAERSKLLSSDELDYLESNNAETHPAHNHYLDTLSELGLFGFMFFIIWLYQSYIGLKYEKSLDSKIVIILLTFLLISCFFGDLYNIKIFWVLTGISGYYFYKHKTVLL